MGANLLQVSRWLGHSTVQITADVYGHLFPETNDLVIGRLDRALRDALPRSDEQLTTGNASP
jgi:integrase